MTDKAVLTNMSVEEMEGLFEKIPSGDTVRVEIVRILYRKHANSISLVYSEMDKFKLRCRVFSAMLAKELSRENILTEFTLLSIRNL